jgi:hypothetical protein
VAAFREWERFTGERFADLKGIRHPTLVVQGFNDEMIPVRNSYWLAEKLRIGSLLSAIRTSEQRGCVESLQRGFMGHRGVEPRTSRLSGVRSNHLS